MFKTTTAGEREKMLLLRGGGVLKIVETRLLETLGGKQRECVLSGAAGGEIEETT